MLKAILVRIGVAFLTLCAVSALVFLGTEALPGDAASAALGREATPELLKAFREDFGLDRPVLVRYAEWLAGLVQGDLGRAVPSGDPVVQIIAHRAENTVVLSLITIAALIPLSVVLGVASAVRRDSAFDHGVSSTTLSLISTPEFVVGTLLAVVFAVWLALLPPVSLLMTDAPLLGQLELLVLPVVTLLAASCAQTIRMIRASMIDVLQSEYVEMARLKGVPEWRVLVVHALPNALGPTIQVLAINVAWLVGGVVVVEVVFQFPGLGTTLVDAVSNRDLPTVTAIAMLVAAVYTSVNLLADTAVIVLNPRLRLAG